MSILDQFGNPVSTKKLLQEEATPTVTGVRSLIGEYPSIGLNPQKLAGLILRADQGDATAYLELAEELEEKDTHYASVIGTRKRAVAQLEISVVPASDDPADIENANFIESWMTRDQLEIELFNMLDAIGKSYSVTEIIWDVTENLWLPKDLKWRDPRWFEFDRTDGETLLLKDVGKALPLSPYKFIVHKHQSKSGLPVRGGIARPCMWMWLFKNFSIKDWVIFAEAYGQPVRVGKYGAGATQADKDVLMRAVSRIGSDAAAIIPDSMLIEFIEAGGKKTTADVFKDLANFADLQISKAVLGQTTTTDALPGGGLAGNQAHNDVRGDIERADAKQLAATLNEQLIKPMIILNKGEQKRYPRLRIGRSEEVNIEQLSAAAERAVKMGVKVSASKLREQLNLPAPDDDKDTLVVPKESQGRTEDDTDTASRRPQLETASQTAAADKDPLDDIVEELASDYEEVLAPAVEIIQQALDGATDFETFRQQLLEIAGQVNSKKLADLLGEKALLMRIAGNAEVPLE